MESKYPLDISSSFYLIVISILIIRKIDKWVIEVARHEKPHLGYSVSTYGKVLE